MPGLVDAHVHLNEPGRAEWEGFETGTQAAACGGVTTVIDMPLNSIPPTTTVGNLREKVEAARGKVCVDVGFYGGIIPGNGGDLKKLAAEGVRGFKGFMIESGVDEFPMVTKEDIELALRELKDEKTTLMFHAEMEGEGEDGGDAKKEDGEETTYQTFLDSRPPSLEANAVRQVIDLAHVAPELHLHIVHLSATECIPILREARQKGINITAETCFHYLGLAAEEVEDGDTRYKCCPPIRGKVNQVEVWEELRDPKGCIQTVVSDHSPCTPELKLLPSRLRPSSTKAALSEFSPTGSFMTAWGGISSLGLGLPILHTNSQSCSPPSLSLTDIARLCSQNTAKQVGLSHKKGGLAVGMDADLCVFDDEEEWTFQKGDMKWRNKCSPWEGKRFVGKVKETWLRGKRVWDGEKVVGGRGELLLERRKE